MRHGTSLSASPTASTDRLPYHEYFDIQVQRIGQVAEVLEARGIKLALSFSTDKTEAEGKQFPFIVNAEGLTALTNAISNSNVGCLIDTWSWVVSGGTLEQITALTRGEDRRGSPRKCQRGR